MCKKHYLRQCLLFAFQLKKLAVEAIAGNFNLEEDDRSGALRKFDDDELEELLNENPTRMQEELVEKSAVMK
ncbi:hypothetical protein APICC_01689 [Apis cerana cerana]|uniref:Uncharacterized protein n=1 Tax=Apis cerana cerana TaxID=94128 RepID=A0A2A3E1H8_APICC|nr:hypothetical protein APICC_01689 [Apis cerana cerana]